MVQDGGGRQSRSQYYVTSSVTDHQCKQQQWLNSQLNLHPALTDAESMEQLAQFI